MIWEQGKPLLEKRDLGRLNTFLYIGATDCLFNLEILQVLRWHAQ